MFFIKPQLYGLIIGLSIVIGSWFVEKQFRQDKFLTKIFYKVGLFSFLFGIIGARLWHVATDYYLYRSNFIAIFEVWNGGLSIFGGILGGVIGLIVSTLILKEFKNKSLNKRKIIILKLLDYSIFGLPVSQAIGRLGNYFNQELYGSPTSGFLKIFIDKTHRLPGFEKIEYYHPLFFYEILATGFFVLLLYIIRYKSKFIISVPILKNLKIPRIGSGNLFLFYLFCYSLVRFLLDFLRLDKTVLSIFSLGVNQVFLVCLLTVISIYYLYLWFVKYFSYNESVEK